MGGARSSSISGALHRKSAEISTRCGGPRGFRCWLQGSLREPGGLGPPAPPPAWEEPRRPQPHSTAEPGGASGTEARDAAGPSARSATLRLHVPSSERSKSQNLLAQAETPPSCPPLLPFSGGGKTPPPAEPGTRPGWCGDWTGAWGLGSPGALAWSSRPHSAAPGTSCSPSPFVPQNRAALMPLPHRECPVLTPGAAPLQPCRSEPLTRRRVGPAAQARDREAVSVCRQSPSPKLTSLPVPLAVWLLFRASVADQSWVQIPALLTVSAPTRLRPPSLSGKPRSPACPRASGRPGRARHPEAGVRGAGWPGPAAWRVPSQSWRVCGAPGRQLPATSWENASQAGGWPPGPLLWALINYQPPRGGKSGEWLPAVLRGPATAHHCSLKPLVQRTSWWAAAGHSGGCPGPRGCGRGSPRPCGTALPAPQARPLPTTPPWQSVSGWRAQAPGDPMTRSTGSGSLSLSSPPPRYQRLSGHFIT